jgi:hypothetical protein
MKRMQVKVNKSIELYPLEHTQFYYADIGKQEIIFMHKNTTFIPLAQRVNDYLNAYWGFSKLTEQDISYLAYLGFDTTLAEALEEDNGFVDLRNIL